MVQILRFTNCFLADCGELKREDLYVDLDSGIIVGKPEELEDVKVIDLEGKIITPGFIDIQINGCFGLDYSMVLDTDVKREEIVDKYGETMKKLVQYGVTSICPTITSSLSDVYKDSLGIFGEKTRCVDKTDSLGVHLEGPFISMEKKGCHPLNAITAIKGYESLIDRYGEGFEKYTSIITAAPELEGCVEVIKRVVDNKIVFSMGHSMSKFDEALEAVKEGASMITHLYNAMPCISAREPGLAGLINAPECMLPREKLPFFGIVADGVHVHPAMIKSAFNANPEKVILVTDAMYLIGLKDGVYKRGVQELEKNGKHVLLNGTSTIAGSATHLIECVVNFTKWTGVPIEIAVATVTNHPSLSLGLQDKKGFLKIGCDADLNIFNEKFELVNVYKLGYKVK
ncbi:hypothetical protein CANINC_000080 [Pichia inconspicua]|uniref:N-acetylglucosamine-6-phosphate deacetylase n=1 Tax=Pichia inconspicua TaxID=52247 RepID=A0A4T0X7E7_9ASCO|nr:hypothetical protein CANINC_000080 [[Candida] inconspicua]